MKVRFAPDVFDSADAWKFLDIIVFKHFFSKRHEWDVPNPAVVRKSRWFVDNANTNNHWHKTNAEILEKSATRSINAAKQVNACCIMITVSHQASAPHTLAPEDAEHALNLPVFIVVENGESDRAFLDATIRAFDRRAIRKALEKEWCHVVSAGGCGEIPKRVREIVPRVKNGPRRIVIIADSDRMIPFHTSTAGAKTSSIRELEACRDDQGVELFVLNKREIENYLPIEALASCPSEKRHVLKAFRQLSQKQRDHYDMKKGFTNKKGEFEISVEQESLYNNISEPTLHSLSDGFGERIWKLFNEPSDVLNKTVFLASCPDDPGEIERMLDTIERLL